jgi:hypothetical protein
VANLTAKGREVKNETRPRAPRTYGHLLDLPTLRDRNKRDHPCLLKHLWRVRKVLLPRMPVRVRDNAERNLDTGLSLTCENSRKVLYSNHNLRRVKNEKHQGRRNGFRDGYEASQHGACSGRRLSRQSLGQVPRRSCSQLSCAIPSQHFSLRPKSSLQLTYKVSRVG